MISGLLAACTAFFFKVGMMFSHWHYIEGLITLKPMVLVRHIEYGTLFRVGRPLITYSPF